MERRREREEEMERTLPTLASVSLPLSPFSTTHLEAEDDATCGARHNDDPTEDGWDKEANRKSWNPRQDRTAG